MNTNHSDILEIDHIECLYNWYEFILWYNDYLFVNYLFKRNYMINKITIKIKYWNYCYYINIINMKMIFSITGDSMMSRIIIIQYK